jgi:uncharacterized protein HemX
MPPGDFATLVTLISTNPLALVVLIVLVIGTGGVGVALIQAHNARKLNIGGNALVKEKTSIDGFTALSTIQETTITRQENTIKAQGITIAEQGEKIDALVVASNKLERKFDRVVELLYNEIALSDARESDRINAGREPMPRNYAIDVPVLENIDGTMVE